MNRTSALGAIAALLTASSTAGRALAAAPNAAASPPLSPAEARFVSQIQTNLNAHFPTPATAERAGYHRFTNEDSSGAISYANFVWTSSDPAVPAQLWYDVHGRLLGADYSVLQANSPNPPALFGIASSRFQKLPAHIHYVLRNADGSMTYSRAVRYATYAQYGDPMHPTAEGLVKAGVAQSAGQVALVFLYPAIWDVSVWILPNPSGAFADLNPNVQPSKPPNPNDQG